MSSFHPIEPVLDQVKNFSPHPKGTLENNRLIFDELYDDRFSVAARKKGCLPLFGDYERVRVIVNEDEEGIWINIKSVMKRLGLPREIILSNLENFNKIIEIAKDKQMFLIPSFRESAEVPLLPISPSIGSLIPLERIAKIADAEHRCIRLSKQIFPDLAESMDVFPDGFIAFDTAKVIGRGGNAKVRLCKTLDGSKIAKRIQMIRCSLTKAEKHLLRAAKIMNKLREKTGVLHTLSIGIYQNKRGVLKFVSFHPLYDQTLDKPIQNEPTKQDRMRMAHELLKGLALIAEKGVHRDLHYKNILLKTTQPFSAVISDFEFFRYHKEKVDVCVSLKLAPDEHGTKRDVWDIGCALYRIFQRKFRPFPWERRFSTKDDINQKNLDESIKACEFSPEQEELLRGMLALNSEERWTPQHCLEYFEKSLLQEVHSVEDNFTS